jgi:hypothetical protein
MPFLPATRVVFLVINVGVSGGCRSRAELADGTTSLCCRCAGGNSPKHISNLIISAENFFLVSQSVHYLLIGNLDLRQVAHALRSRPACGSACDCPLALLPTLAARPVHDCEPLAVRAQLEINTRAVTIYAPVSDDVLDNYNFVLSRHPVRHAATAAAAA